MRPSTIKVRQLSSSCPNFRKVASHELTSKVKGQSSQHWLSRQLSDPYVEKAKMMNYRCRSAFKLIEIDNRFKILQPGHTVIDCGAAPGSWTQVAVKRVNSDGSQINKLKGKVLAIDRQLIYPIEGATIFGNMDFTIETSQKALLETLNNEKVDSVLSDMAPTATGIKDLDTENILKLCYAVLKFALEISKQGGNVLMKLWQCGETQKLESDIGRFYENAKIIKPKSSRSDSTEIFIVGRNFKGLKES